MYRKHYSSPESEYAEEKEQNQNAGERRWCGYRGYRGDAIIGY
jgi:hypothetical protein